MRGATATRETELDFGGANVYSKARNIEQPKIKLPKGIHPNRRLKMDGLKLLAKLPEKSVPAAFLDPQYRSILDKMGYGNEGKTRGKARCALKQMDAETISKFVQSIDRVLIPTGHLFLWMDKFEVLNGFRTWMEDTELEVVDMVSWDKARMGMGYRTRRITEYCVILQKKPKRAKGVWKIHNIPDTWREKAPVGKHPHRKPVELQAKLIEAVTNEGDLVLDPCAGSFSVLEACRRQGRNFVGCDLNG